MSVDLGIIIIRVLFGVALAAHGSQKLFGWFGGYGLKGTGGFFEQLGFRPGVPFAADPSTSRCQVPSARQTTLRSKPTAFDNSRVPSYTPSPLRLPDEESAGKTAPRRRPRPPAESVW